MFARLTAIFSLIVLTMLAIQARAESVGVRLFTVFSYAEGPWTQGLNEGITGGFARRAISSHRESFYLDYAEYDKLSVAAQTKLRRKLLARIRAYQPDYLVICDDEAMLRLLPDLYAIKKPIIFTGINGSEASIAGLTTHRGQITGVFERYPIAQSLRLIQDLGGKQLDKITLITTATDSSLAIIEAFRGFFLKHPSARLDKVVISDDWEEWQKVLEHCNAVGSVPWVLVPFTVKDQRGRIVDLNVMGRWMTRELRIPSLSIVDVPIQMGIMASVSVTPQVLGEEAARLIALNFRDKIAIADIPFQYPDKSTIIINKQITDHLGLKIPIELLEYGKIVVKTSLGTKP